MQGLKDTVKIGAVVIASCFGVWGATALISGIDKLTHRNTYYVFARFDNAKGLKPKMQVTADGLQVGYVEWVRRDDQTRVPTAKIRIGKGVTVYAGSHFVISQSGLLGDGELRLEDPPLGLGELPSEVKEGDELTGTTEKGLQDMIARADQILQRVDNLLGEDSMGGALRQLTSSVGDSLDKVNGIAQQVDTLLRDNSQLITGSMQNLNAMSVNFVQLSRTLEETGNAIHDLSTDPRNKEQLESVLANLNAASASLAATSKQAESLAGDAELQQNIKDTLRLTKETLEETKKTVTQFQGTLGTVDGTLQKAEKLMDSTGAAVDDARGALGRLTRLGGKDGGCEEGKGLEAKGAVYLRGLDHNASGSADSRDRVVADARAALGLNGKYVAAGVDNIGDGGRLNLLLGLGSPLEGASARAGIYRGELAAGMAFYGGGFGAEITAYGPQDPRLDAYGYLPVGDSVEVVIGVEDATGSTRLTTGAGLKF